LLVVLSTSDDGGMETLMPAACMELLRSEYVAHLAVSAERGPYVTPISYVFSGDEIAFPTGPGERLMALLADPRVCIEVSRYDRDTGAWQSVVVRGTAHRITDETRIQAIVRGILAKYQEGLAWPRGGTVSVTDEVVIGVTIGEMTGRHSGGYLTVPGRPGS
jgi:nitroimidazol reductase NimA-like FMN-containing flavoprotein (pyridoxamine 5'-phosphate oxidase superfamily)